MTHFDHLLAEMRAAHVRHPALAEFVAFPDDLARLPMTALHRPCADVMYGLDTFRDAPDPLARAFYEAGPEAHWRETYADTDIGDTFLASFGCYCAIGDGGAWQSRKMSAYVVTMPPNFFYTWHHHPAEELYFVLAGSGVFHRAGAPAETLTAGQAMFHKSGQPHALETTDTPIMAYVLWRNQLDISPELTDPDTLAAYASGRSVST